MFRCVYLLRLFYRPVVQPQDDIVIIPCKFGTRHGDRLVCVVGKDSQGTGSIEADTSNGVPVDAVGTHRSLDGVTNTCPDVGR